MKAVSNLTLTSFTLDQDYTDWLQLEGECKASQIIPMKRYHWITMIIITILYSIVTCIVGLLGLKYSIRLRAWLYYEDV
jgi:hypothetical protein